jgi:hypothetical protein
MHMSPVKLRAVFLGLCMQQSSGPDQRGRGTVTLAVMEHFHRKIPKRGSIFKNYGNSILAVRVQRAARSNRPRTQPMARVFFDRAVTRALVCNFKKFVNFAATPLPGSYHMFQGWLDSCGG